MSWGDLLRYILLGAAILAGLALVLYVIRRAIKSGQAAEMLREIATQVAETRAAAEIKKTEARLGKEKAIAKVQVTYAEQMEALDEAEQIQAKDLHEDPVALSRFLVRAGRKRNS